MGNDLAPVLAAKLDTACVLDADDLKTDGGAVLARRTEFDRKAGTWFAAVAGKALVATLKDGAADALAPDAARSGAVTAVAVSLTEADQKAKVISRDVAKKSVNLKGARVIVAAGAGVGNKDNFVKIQDLADQSWARRWRHPGRGGCGLAAGRPVDRPPGLRFGPTSTSAAASSGAVRHWVGMMDARTIVAINSDKNAP